MEYLPEFLTITVVHLLAVMSPGPDFAMISRNSLIYSRRTGLYASVGLALGVLVHVAYSLVGIGLIISRSVVIFSIIKFMGAGYLIYIGIKSLKAKPPEASLDSLEIQSPKDLTTLQALRTGFLTNVLNPKVTLFFLSIFTQVIDTATPLGVQVLYGLEMSVMTFVWFGFVAVVLSQPKVKTNVMRFGHHVERVFGGLLIALGLKIAFSKS